MFWTFRKTPAKDEPSIIRDSLRYALDLFQNPEKHSFEHFTTGLAAYDNWAKAVEAGYGASHGSWWNAMVWSECRAMAGAWFEELAAKHNNISSQAHKLSGMYKEIAANLEKISNKEMDPGEKVRIVRKIKTMEQEAIGNVEKLLTVFGW